MPHRLPIDHFWFALLKTWMRQWIVIGVEDVVVAETGVFPMNPVVVLVETVVDGELPEKV